MKIKKHAIFLCLFLPLLAQAFGDEWIIVFKQQSENKSYYLNPQSLKTDINDKFQIGLIILDGQTGVELSDLQVTGCGKGRGTYKITYAGDLWRKPRQWDRNGTQDFDKISSVMCEVIRECKSSYQSAIAKRKAGQKVEYIEQGKYFKEVSVSSIEMQCKDGK
ncbi:MAG: hypothetical protein H7240_03880 [Glaciimonas sp.]|nr:hypothetical protein [Glaciimonas sp.]